MTEIMVSLTLSTIVLAGAYAAFFACLNMWQRSQLLMRISEQNSRVLSRMVYGGDGGGGLREADSVAIATSANGWTATYHDGNSVTQSFRYNRPAGTIVHAPSSRVVCSNVVFASAVPNAGGGGLSLRVDLAQTERSYSCSNSMSTFIEFRNRHD